MHPPPPAPLILFGAFDRHNFGDLLLARIAAAQAAAHAPRRPLLYAGLADRDLSVDGGMRVRPLDELARALGRRRGAGAQAPPPGLLQVGGEILDCGAYEAAIMLLSGDEARAAIARHDRDPAGRERWARQWLEVTRELPYLAPRHLFPAGTRIVHAGIGGVGLARRSAAARGEALACMRASSPTPSPAPR